MNILEILIIILTVLLALSGFRKGFVRKLASMVSLVLSLVLVSIFLPYITDFLKEKTPVYDYIVEHCEDAVAVQAQNLLTRTSADGNSDGSSDGNSDGSSDGASDESSDGSSNGSSGGASGEAVDKEALANTSFGRIDQMEIIENLPIPQMLKDMLLDYNNEEGYEQLQVTRFLDYVSAFIASVILNVVAFILSVIIVQIFLWLVINMLDLLANVPVIRVVNRLAGLALGLLEALFFIWLFFLVLSMLSATDVGMFLMSMVQESEFLGELYDSNLFLTIVLRGAAIFG